MKKIMFDTKYGLEQAVLEGRKTMTRRFIPARVQEAYENSMRGIVFPACVTMQRKHISDFYLKHSPFKVGDKVAICQSYKSLGYMPELLVYTHGIKDGKYKSGWFPINEQKGWENKMYVKSDLMKHFIEITDVKVQLLSHISDEDALKEGIQQMSGFKGHIRYTFPTDEWGYDTPKEAFSALLEKVSGQKAVGYDRWVYAYTFKLIE